MIKEKGEKLRGVRGGEVRKVKKKRWRTEVTGGYLEEMKRVRGEVSKWCEGRMKR